MWELKEYPIYVRGRCTPSSSCGKDYTNQVYIKRRIHVVFRGGGIYLEGSTLGPHVKTWTLAR
jgi:hypothetical protein